MMCRAVGMLKSAGMHWGTLACGGASFPACERAPVHRLARKSRNSTAPEALTRAPELVNIPHQVRHDAAFQR